MQRPFYRNQGMASKFPSWPPQGNPDLYRAPEYTKNEDGVVNPSQLPKSTAQQAMCLGPYETCRVPDPKPDYDQIPSGIWEELKAFDGLDSSTTEAPAWFQNLIAVHMDCFKEFAHSTGKIFINIFMWLRSKL